MNGFFAWLMGLLAIIPGSRARRRRRAGTAMSRTTMSMPRPRPAAPSPSIAGARKGRWSKQGDVLFVLDSRQQQAQLRRRQGDAPMPRGRRSQICRPAAGRKRSTSSQAQLQKAQSDLRWRQQNLTRDAGPVRSQGCRRAVAARSGQGRGDSRRRRRSTSSRRSSRWRNCRRATRSRSAAEAQSQRPPRREAQHGARRRSTTRTVTAPEDGRIERLFFKQGEVAGAGVPVLSIERRGALKIKFYVDEARAAAIRAGPEDRALAATAAPRG